MRQAFATVMRPDPWAVLVGPDLGRCSVAMAGDQPVGVVPGGESEQRQPQLFDGLEVAHPEQVLLQRPDEALGEALLDAITKDLKKGNKVVMTGFGTFRVSKRAARTGVNPRNPSEKIKIPAMKVEAFKAGKGLKEAVR